MVTQFAIHHINVTIFMLLHVIQIITIIEIKKIPVRVVFSHRSFTNRTNRNLPFIRSIYLDIYIYAQSRSLTLYILRTRALGIIVGFHQLSSLARLPVFAQDSAERGPQNRFSNAVYGLSSISAVAVADPGAWPEPNMPADCAEASAKSAPNSSATASAGNVATSRCKTAIWRWRLSRSSRNVLWRVGGCCCCCWELEMECLVWFWMQSDVRKNCVWHATHGSIGDCSLSDVVSANSTSAGTKMYL